jgi:hypothetical protein
VITLRDTLHPFLTHALDLAYRLETRVPPHMRNDDSRYWHDGWALDIAAAERKLAEEAVGWSDAQWALFCGPKTAERDALVKRYGLGHVRAMTDTALNCANKLPPARASRHPVFTSIGE